MQSCGMPLNKKIAAIGGMSQEDKLRVFSGNANRLYRCAGSPGKL